MEDTRTVRRKRILSDGYEKVYVYHVKRSHGTSGRPPKQYTKKQLIQFIHDLPDDEIKPFTEYIKGFATKGVETN